LTAKKEAITDHCLPEAYAAWEDEQKRLRQEAILHRRGFETLAKAAAVPARERSLAHRANWQTALQRRCELLSRLHRHDMEQMTCLQEQLIALQDRVTVLEDKNARLLLKLRQQLKIKPAAKGQSAADKPDTSKVSGKEACSESKKRRGAPTGHRGASRPVPKNIDDTHMVPPPGQCNCGGIHIQPTDQFDHKYVQDIPPVCCVTTLWKYQHGLCQDCGQAVWHEEGFQGPPVVIGPNLRAHLTMMRQMGSSFRKLSDFCTETLGIALTPAGVLGIVNRTSEQLLPAYREIASELPSQPYLHGDETGWKVRGKNWNLWVLCNRDLTYFHSDQSRGSKVPRRLLGADYPGIVICDFYSAYNFLPKTQRCLIHLLRDLKEERQLRPSHPTLREFEQRLHDLIQAGKQVQAMPEGQIKNKRIDELTQELQAIANMTLPRGKPQNLTKRISRYQENLLRFVSDPRVEYHNNRAERQLRPSVITRKTSFGSDTEQGAQRHCVINSVVQTCRLQDRRPIDYLKQAINAPPGIPPTLFETD